MKDAFEVDPKRKEMMNYSDVYGSGVGEGRERVREGRKTMGQGE